MTVGAALPVVFLSGWGGSFASVYGDVWRDRCAMVGREAVAIELPGHANRIASGDPADYADLAGQVGRRLPQGRFDVIAFSLGAKLALELALSHPGRVGRMVLGGVGNNVFAVEPAGEDIAFALEHGAGPTTTPHAVAMVDYSAASGSDPRALAAVLRRPANPVHTSARMAALLCPTLVVNGDLDRVAIPDEQLIVASNQITGLRLAGVNHIDLPGHPAFISAAVAYISVDGDDPANTPSEALT